MPSPENNQRELPDNALTGTPKPHRRLRPWVWILLILLVGVPLTLTLISALTSPPHVSGVPMGKLVYLDADSPSEKTTTLRGLFVTQPGAGPRLLVHESEPQDVDAGAREWITQPVASPDGTQVAFEKQIITLLDEQQSIDNQLWVMPLNNADPELKPHLLLDLTPKNMKQVVGLAWDSDSSIMFLEDGLSYSLPTQEAGDPMLTPLDLAGLTLAPSSNISATRAPNLTEAGAFAFSALTATGPQVVISDSNGPAIGPPAAIFALSPDAQKIAYVPTGTNGVIRIYNVASKQTAQDIKVRWGWSVFGRRHITSLRWSPDGTDIGFTVSKPPVPEDELFYVDPAGKTWQMPVRVGRAAWDWAH